VNESRLFRNIRAVLRVGLIIFGLLFSFLPIQADVGPKPQIILTIENAPNEPFYVDLLVRKSGSNESLLNLEEYDPNMIEALKSQESLGWYPALVNGTQTRLMGNIIPEYVDQVAICTFSQSIPDEYRVILVTRSGIVRISETLETKAFLTRIEFDAVSGKISSSNWIWSSVLAFVMMLVPTFLIEGFLLWVFKLFNRHNIKVFSITNLLTQVFLLLTSAFVYYYFGLVMVIFVVILDEWVILIIETFIFARFLDHPSMKRKIFYGITANILSFFIGLVIAMYFQ